MVFVSVHVVVEVRLMVVGLQVLLVVAALMGVVDIIFLVEVVSSQSSSLLLLFQPLLLLRPPELYVGFAATRLAARAKEAILILCISIDEAKDVGIEWIGMNVRIWTSQS